MAKTKSKIKTLPWREGVTAVIAGRLAEFEDKSVTVSIQEIEQFMVSLGWAVKEEDGQKFTSNGWQFDWWMNFAKKTQQFTAAGSGYYGGISFHQTDEF